MDYQIYSLAEIEISTNLSRASIYRRINDDATFPRKVSLGGRRIGFLKSEVDAWVQAQIDSKHGTSKEANP